MTRPTPYPSTSTRRTLYRNGHVAHGRAHDPATAIAVEGDRIVFVGTEDRAEAWTGDDAAVVDLDGALVTPGFVDATCTPCTPASR